MAEEAAAEILAAVGHEALPCPARKLELVVYTEDAARSPSIEPNFELNLDTGPGELRVDLEPQPGEGHWFAIDRSVLAAHGIAIHGPPANQVFVSPNRADLLPLLGETLRWYQANDPDSEAGRRNAGRSLLFAREGIWVPKTAVEEHSLSETIAELEAG